MSVVDIVGSAFSGQVESVARYCISFNVFVFPR